MLEDERNRAETMRKLAEENETLRWQLKAYRELTKQIKTQQDIEWIKIKLYLVDEISYVSEVLASWGGKITDMKAEG